MMDMIYKENKDCRPLGSVSTVIRKAVRDGLAQDANVPCGTCTACCKSGYEVELTPEEASRFPHVFSGSDGAPVLEKAHDGSCSLLKDGKCSVYNDRPRACRRYDCRFMALAGTITKPLMDAGYIPFKVEAKTAEDRKALFFIRLAALAAYNICGAIDTASAIGVSAWVRYRERAVSAAESIAISHV